MIAISKKRKKKKKGAEDMALQITSMADVFTILLVFLLKSFSSDPQVLAPQSGIKLPKARTGANGQQMVKVEVNRNSIEIEGRKVASLQEFQLNPSDLLPNGTIATVNDAMAEERRKHPGAAPAAQNQSGVGAAVAEVKPDARIAILADMKVPYSTLKTVLASAANYGFTEYKLVVVKDEE